MQHSATGILIHMELVYTIFACLGILGTVGVMLLKNIFVTKKGCVAMQADCQNDVCVDIKALTKKVDDGELIRNSAVKENGKFNLWVAVTLTRIATELKVEIEDVPK